MIRGAPLYAPLISGGCRARPSKPMDAARRRRSTRPAGRGSESERLFVGAQCSLRVSWVPMVPSPLRSCSVGDAGTAPGAHGLWQRS